MVCCVVLCACLLELGTKRAHRFDTYCVGKEAMTALRRTEELLFARHVSRMLRSDEALACKAVAEEEKRAEEGRGKRTRNENTHRYTQVHTGAHVGAERGRSAQDTPLTNDMILVRVREFGHEYEHDDR